MPFSKIIEKSIKYPWNNRALWFYGVLIALFAGGSNISSSYSPSAEEAERDFEKIKSIFNLDPKALFIVCAILVLLAFVIGILALIIGSWSQIAINRGVAMVEKKEKISRKELGKTGKRAVWKMIVLNFFIPIVLVFALVVLIAAVVLLCIALPKALAIVAGVLLGTFIFFGVIAGSFYLSALWPMAERFVSNDESNAIDALRSAAALIKNSFWITFGFNFVTGIIAGMAVLLGSIPLFVLGLGLIGFAVAKIYVGVAIIAVLTLGYLIPLLLIAGYFQAFLQTARTLWWLELRKTNK